MLVLFTSTLLWVNKWISAVNVLIKFVYFVNFWLWYFWHSQNWIKQDWNENLSYIRRQIIFLLFFTRVSSKNFVYQDVFITVSIFDFIVEFHPLDSKCQPAFLPAILFFFWISASHIRETLDHTCKGVYRNITFYPGQKDEQFNIINYAAFISWLVSIHDIFKNEKKTSDLPRLLSK